MDREHAAELIAAHLQLIGYAVVTASPSNQPLEGHTGVVLQMRQQGGGWVALLWPDAAPHTIERTTDNPAPLRRVVVDAGGVVTEEPINVQEHRLSRAIGRPPKRPRGLGQRARIQATLYGEDLTEIQLLTTVHELTESAVVQALIAQALRGVPLPWG